MAVNGKKTKRAKQAGVILRGMEKHSVEWRWVKNAAKARETNAATIIARMVKLTKALVASGEQANLLEDHKLEPVTR